MTKPRVTGLRGVELGVVDLEASIRFYESCWGLNAVAVADGAAWFRAGGSEHHVLVLRSTPERKLIRIDLAADGRETVDSLYRKARGAGATVEAPRQLSDPGGGYGFVFRDPYQRAYAITTDVARHDAPSQAPDRPVKLSHVVLNSPDRESQSAQFIDLFGFTLSDRTGYMDFIRCSSDHHALAYTTIDAATLNHCAFEMPSHDGLMRAAGRMKRAGYPVEWGVGRHGPGNNIFAYFLDPEGYVIEYTTEVEQVDETYRTGMPADWERPADFHGDSWGFAAPASERFREASRG